MSLMKFSSIKEFKEFLDKQIKNSENELKTISKIAGEKLRKTQKEFENDKEFQLIKEKLEDKSDEKKKKKSKKQFSANWVNYESLNLYNGMGGKGELEIHFKEIENLKQKLEKQQLAKQTLGNLLSKGLKKDLSCLVYENNDKFDMVLVKTTQKIREKFSFQKEFSVNARLEKPVFVESLLK